MAKFYDAALGGWIDTEMIQGSPYNPTGKTTPPPPYDPRSAIVPPGVIQPPGWGTGEIPGGTGAFGGGFDPTAPIGGPVAPPPSGTTGTVPGSMGGTAGDGGAGVDPVTGETTGNAPSWWKSWGDVPDVLGSETLDFQQKNKLARLWAANEMIPYMDARGQRLALGEIINGIPSLRGIPGLDEIWTNSFDDYQRAYQQPPPRIGTWADAMSWIRGGGDEARGQMSNLMEQFRSEVGEDNPWGQALRSLSLTPSWNPTTALEMTDWERERKAQFDRIADLQSGGERMPGWDALAEWLFNPQYSQPTFSVSSPIPTGQKGYYGGAIKMW